ncbi:MAG: DUF4860 domain-containing protein [Clostridia bacterium]|nr:DUF4860 domain-containing protein [Clostridia bacterium]
MKPMKARTHAISGVFVFLLLGIFAVFSTVMVLLGAKAYKGSADRAADHNAARIAAAYVRSMVRSDDEAGALRVEDQNGVTTVAMENVYDDETYITRIYVCDGMLREWFTDAETEFEPENGEAVCLADEMTAAMENGLLTIQLRNADAWTRVEIALRSAR